MVGSGRSALIAEQRRGSGKAPSPWIGSVYYLMFFFCNGSYIPFIYVYFADLGLSGKQIGLLATLSPVVTLLVATPVATFADRRRLRVRVAQVGLACTGVVVFLLRLPSTFGIIVLLMLFLAVFSIPISSISEGLIARIAQRHRLNFGAMRLWGSLGFAVSSLGCGALWQAFGFKHMFLVAGLLCLPLILVTGRLEEGPIVPALERKPASELLRDGGLVLLLVATFLAGISNSLAMTFSGVYARWLGGGNLLVGTMVAVSAVAELPTMFFSNRISGILKEKNAVVVSYLLMALAFVGFALIDDPQFLPIFSVVKGLGYGIWITVTIRLVTKRTSEEWASTAQSLLTMCLWGLAPLVAGPVGGLIHDAVSPAAVFWLAAISLGLAGAVILAAGIHGRLDQAEETAQ